MPAASRCAALGAVLVAAPAALAADPQGMSTFVPVQTTDALILAPGQATLQGYGVFTRDTYNGSGSSLLNLDPQIKVGVIKGVQLDITAPYAVGDQSAASQGSGGINGFYQFTTPSPIRPALALEAGYQFPFGAGHKSNQYFVRALATQWLGSTDKAPRLHLNLDLTEVTTPGPGARRTILQIGLAYSQLISARTALVVDVVHGAKGSTAQNQTIADFGLRHEITDDWAVGGAVGVGLGQQSPGFRLIFAVQRSLKLF